MQAVDDIKKVSAKAFNDSVTVDFHNSCIMIQIF